MNSSNDIQAYLPYKLSLEFIYVQLTVYTFVCVFVCVCVFRPPGSQTMR